MTYSVKELFYTLQGEGAQAGRAAVFCRFAGCNLWTGREQDRATAVCTFCDTDFVGTDGEGGGKFATADAPLVLTSGHELKLVYPQPLAQPERFAQLDFQNFFLQPMDSVLQREHTKAAVAYCMAHPQWRLSVQMHKVVGIA